MLVFASVCKGAVVFAYVELDSKVGGDFLLKRAERACGVCVLPPRALPSPVSDLYTGVLKNSDMK